MRPLLLSALLFLSVNVFAQEETEKKKEKEYYENEAHDRIVMSFSFDNWIFDKDEIDSLETKWNSWGFSFYYMYDKPLGKSKFSAAAGMGFRASWVKNNSYLDDSVDSLGTFFRPLDTLDYKRNSLSVLYFDIPLELRYRSKPNSKNKSFKMAAGCIGGIQMNNHTSTKAEFNGDMRIVKEKRWADLARFHFGPTFRIGYGATNFFFYYSVTSLFKKDSGPDIHPFSAGFTINAL